MREECQQIQDYLEVVISEDVNEVIERGNELSVFIARTGKMMADAKIKLNERMQSEAIEMLRRVAKESPGATTKTINLLADSLCREEKYLVDWTERLNKTATHQLDWCRTLVSKAKQDQYYSRGMNQ